MQRDVVHRMVRAYHEDDLRGEALPRSFGVDSRSAYLAIYASEVEVYPHIRLEPTPAEVAAAREGRLPPSRLIAGEHPQLRWERIAGRAGITPAEARALYERLRGPGSSKELYTGRGRRFPDMH